MAASESLYTRRTPYYGRNTPRYTKGYAIVPALRRVLEDGSPRVLETLTDYRVAERRTVLA